MQPELTSAERKKLKGRAQRLKPLVKLGKAGMTDAFLKSVDSALTDHELVKGKFDDETDIMQNVAGEFLTAEQHVNHSELAVLVDGLLDDLPEEQRLTFTLHHFGGLSLPEIAEVLDTSVPTTKSRLRLAREKLSDRLLQRGVLNPHEPDD